MIEITVNGEPRAASKGQTILGLLQQLELDPARVAVELDRRIVKQPYWQRNGPANGRTAGDRSICRRRVEAGTDAR